MSGNVQVLGLDDLRQRMFHWPAELDRAVRDRVTVEVQPLVGAMRSLAGAVGGSAPLAARSVRVQSTSAGMAVVATATAVLYGAEFGSDRKRRRSYVNRSRKGTAYVVTRRTTKQFKPHLGRRGYWFWPTVRSDLKGINARVGKAINEVVSGG